jgi:hypothetical protein
MLESKIEEFKIENLTDIIGYGEYNVAFKHTDQQNKAWVIKVSNENNIADTPERSIFLWNLLHPENKAKLCKVNDRLAWMCPFIEGQALIEAEKRYSNREIKEIDETIANLIIQNYIQTQRIVLDIAVPGNIIDNKLVDVGYAFFAPNNKNRERRGSIASAATNNNNRQNNFKNIFHSKKCHKTLHAFAAIARQLADTPENRDFKANFSNIDDSIFNSDYLDSYETMLNNTTTNAKAFKYTENSLSKKLLIFTKYFLLLTIFALLIYDLIITKIIINFLITALTITATPALIINASIISLGLLYFIIKPSFSLIKQKISIYVSSEIFEDKTKYDLEDFIYKNTDKPNISGYNWQQQSNARQQQRNAAKKLSRKYNLSVNNNYLIIDSNQDSATPMIYFAGADQTAENAYNAYKTMLSNNTDAKFDLYFQNMPGLVEGTQLKMTNDIDAKYQLVLDIAHMEKYNNKAICLYGYSLGGTVALAVAEKLKHTRYDIYQRLKIVTIDSPTSTSSVVENRINYKGNIKITIKALFCLIFASLLFLTYFLSPIYALYVSNIVACIICIVTTVTIDYCYDLFINFLIRPLMSTAGCDVDVTNITKKLFKNNKLFCVFDNDSMDDLCSMHHAIKGNQNTDNHTYYSKQNHNKLPERYPLAENYNCVTYGNEEKNFRSESDAKINDFLLGQ